MYKCSLFVSSHVSSSDFLWLNKHLFCTKKLIFLSPLDQLLGWCCEPPTVLGQCSACKAGTAGFSIHMLSAVFNHPGGDCVEGKNHLWLAVAWHDLACQLPHKPVVPPLGSSTQVWELIILGQEKQLHNNKRKQANETKQNPRKPPNKQVNLRKVYCHLTLPFVPLGCTALLLLPAPARRMAGKRVSVCKKRVILLLTDTAQSSPTADLSTLIKQMAPGGRTWRCSLFCLHGLATIQLLFVL